MTVLLLVASPMMTQSDAIDSIFNNFDGYSVQNNGTKFIADETSTMLSAIGPHRTNTFTFVIEGVILTNISFLGTFVNVLAIILICKSFPVHDRQVSEDPRLMQRYQRSKQIKKMLIALAIFDMVYLVMAIGIFGLPAMSLEYKKHVYIFILPYL